MMKEKEYQIRNFIGLGKVAKILLFGSLGVTLMLVVLGTAFMLNRGTAKSEKFDALFSEKETYSYIDVVAASDWVYEYKYNDTKMTFYVVEDTDGYLSFATISDKDMANMHAQQLYWNDETGTPPEPYRIYGIAWPLDSSKRTYLELYNATDLESLEDFEDWFGVMYLDCGYNPLEETGWLFFLIALFTGLFFMIMFICLAPQLIKTRKSIKILKDENLIDEAYEELSSTSAIGPCVIGKRFFFVRNKGVAVPMEKIKDCIAYTRSMRIVIEPLGEVIVENLKDGELDQIIEALPFESETIEIEQ